MKPYFTEIARDELNNGYFVHSIDFYLKPFETVSDFLWTFSAVVFFPCYFFALFWLVLIESILLMGHALYSLLMSNNEISDQCISESSLAFQASFFLLSLSIFSAPLMSIIFVARLLASSGLIGPKFFDTPRSARQDSLELSTSYSRYIELMVTINNDRKIIIDSLKSFNCESQHLIGELDALNNKPNKTTNQPIRANGKTEIHRELDRLMISYPFANFSESVTSIEVDEAFIILQLHHSKVVDIAEILLIEINSILNEAKQRNILLNNWDKRNEMVC